MLAPRLLHVRDAGTRADLVDTGIDAVVRGFEVLVPCLRGHQVELRHPDKRHGQVALGFHVLAIIIHHQVGVDVLDQPVTGEVLVRAGTPEGEVRPEIFALARLDDPRFLDFAGIVLDASPPVHAVAEDAGVKPRFAFQVQVEQPRPFRDDPVVFRARFFAHLVAFREFPLLVHVDGQAVLGVIHLHHLHGRRHRAVRRSILQLVVIPGSIEDDRQGMGEEIVPGSHRGILRFSLEYNLLAHAAGCLHGLLDVLERIEQRGSFSRVALHQPPAGVLAHADCLIARLGGTTPFLLVCRRAEQRFALPVAERGVRRIAVEEGRRLVDQHHRLQGERRLLVEISLAGSRFLRPQRKHLYRLVEQPDDFVETGVHVAAREFHLRYALLHPDSRGQQDDWPVFAQLLEIEERLGRFHFRRPQILFLLLHVQRVADVLEKGVAILDGGVIRGVLPGIADGA